MYYFIFKIIIEVVNIRFI